MQLDKRVMDYKDEIIRSTRELIKFKSLKGEPKKGMPFGETMNDTLMYYIDLARDMGFKTKNVDGYAGHAEYGEGEELIGVLVHLDVVPEGDGWTYPPYEGHIVENKIFGRGAIDDKGPAVSVLYALKAIKDSGVKLGKRIRIIAGLDEESGWDCMKHYFKKEEKPMAGFSPDGVFPIINSEMGILIFSMEKDFGPAMQTGVRLLSVNGGQRPNMVPDYCEAIIEGDAETLDTIQKNLKSFADRKGYNMKSEIDTGRLVIKSFGISAHGSTPEKGQNAIARVMDFLKDTDIEGESVKEYIRAIADKIGYETDGMSLSIDLTDDISGKLVFNLGQIDIDKDHGKAVINIRYPIKYDGKYVLAMLEKALKGTGIYIPDDVYDQPPLYVSGDNSVIKALKKVYEDVTGEKANLISIGGGTYARAINNAVAFGPLLPGRPKTAHEKDEHIDIDDLMTITRIYARAMYALGCNR